LAASCAGAQLTANFATELGRELRPSGHDKQVPADFGANFVVSSAGAQTSGALDRLETPAINMPTVESAFDAQGRATTMEHTKTPRPDRSPDGA
jgi:hypothetical protein